MSDKLPDLPGAMPEPHDDEASWLVARRAGLGGSDAPVVMGVSDYATPLALYLEKTGLVERGPLGDPEAAAWGLRLEDDVLEWYAEVKGRTLVRPGRFTIYRSARLPFASATFDALVLDDPRGVGVVNAKTASAFLADRWTKDPPLAYQVQLTHEMLVAGAAWGAIPVLIGGQRAQAFELERDEVFITLLIERETEFWGRVLAKNAPDESDPEAMRAALKRLFPRAQAGVTVSLGDEAIAWDERRRAAGEEIKRWEREKTDAENQLIAAIGEGEFGVLPNGIQYRRRLVHRDAHVVKATDYRELRRLEPR